MQGWRDFCILTGMRGVLIMLLLVGTFFAWPVLAQEELLPEGGMEDAGEMMSAEEMEEEFYRGEVLEVTGERQEEVGIEGLKAYVQTVRVKFLDGVREGQEETVEHGVLSEDKKVAVGDGVVLMTVGENINIFDSYRLPSIWMIGMVFVFLAVLFAGWRGVGSLLGLAVSIAVIVGFVMPRIAAGASPLLISLAGAFVIAVASIYLAHGLNRRSSAALLSVLMVTGVALLLAQLTVWMAGLSGGGSEEAFRLQSSALSFVGLKGLLLGAIVIGALGVLDDVAVNQATAVEEIWKANPALGRRELFRRAAKLGREHTASMINTLALAYVSVSMPVLLLLMAHGRPWWVTFNSEQVAEEIVRTFTGSAALMLIVPVATLLSVYWVPKRLNE